MCCARTRRPGRSLRLTPLDIQKHRFATRFRGLDGAEVQDFLRMVAEDYESLVNANETLRETVRQLDARLEEHVANEKALQETLITAQSLTEDLRRTAVRESEMLVSEAELKAGKVLDAVHRRIGKLADDIREMKGLRSRIAADVRTTVETHLNILEGIADDWDEDSKLERKVAALMRGWKAHGDPEGAG